MAASGSFLSGISSCAMGSARAFVCVDATSEGPKIWAPAEASPLRNCCPVAGGLGERGSGHGQFN